MQTTTATRTTATLNAQRVSDFSTVYSSCPRDQLSRDQRDQLRIKVVNGT